MKFNTITSTPDLIEAFDELSMNDVDFPAYDVTLEFTPMFNENNMENTVPLVVQGIAWKATDAQTLADKIQNQSVKDYITQHTDPNYTWTIATQQ